MSLLGLPYVALSQCLRVFAVLVALCPAAKAQHPNKIPRVGYLSAFTPAIESTRAETIRGALRELGYIEGQNIVIEYRFVEGKPDRFPELAAELVRLKPDVIVALGGCRLIQAAKDATKTIPIIMVGAGDNPVATGLVENLARSGGNVTGLTDLTTNLSGKRLELLKEAVPKVARVALLYDPVALGTVLQLKDLPVARGLSG